MGSQGNYGQTPYTAEGFHSSLADRVQTHLPGHTCDYTHAICENCLWDCEMSQMHDNREAMVGYSSYSLKLPQDYSQLLETQFLPAGSGHERYNGLQLPVQGQTSSFTGPSTGPAEFFPSSPSLSRGSASSSRQSSLYEDHPPFPNSEEQWAPSPSDNAQGFPASHANFGIGFSAAPGNLSETNAHAGGNSVGGNSSPEDDSSAFDSTNFTVCTQGQAANLDSKLTIPSRKKNKNEKYVAKVACGKEFTSANSWSEASSNACRHIREFHRPPTHICHVCFKPFKRPGSLKKHIESQHPYPCGLCNKRFDTIDDLNAHVATRHRA